MAALSRDHPDGWGIAAGKHGGDWTRYRSIERAGADGWFHVLAASALGEILVAHVRQRTEGPLSLENTHPFAVGDWAFAHNGTVVDVAYLKTGTSAYRLGQVQGQTDSERLFAFLLTRLDEARAVRGRRSLIDAVLRDAVRSFRRRRAFGTASFILSDGDVLYAYRRGPPLHLLERRPQSGIECPECRGTPCIAVTTEPITDEAWLPLDDGELLRVERTPAPAWTKV